MAGMSCIFLPTRTEHDYFSLYLTGMAFQETGMNLATCLWQSRKYAPAANSRPHLIKTMRLAVEVYDLFALERYMVRKIQGERGEVGW